MDTTSWDRAIAKNAPVDRRESRAVRRIALVFGVFFVLVSAANQLGVTRPALSFTGESAGSADSDRGWASVHPSVANRGLFPERVEQVEIDDPGLTVRSAQLRPDPLPAFGQGQLDVEMSVDCDARHPDGSAAWDETAIASGEITIRITTSRPWGTASRTYSGAEPAWTVLQTAGLACHTP